MMPWTEIGKQINEIRRIKVEADREIVQCAALIGITVLGTAAMIVDGDVGMTIAIGCTAGLGAAVGYLFPRKNDNTNGGGE
ncbi:MAG: hypothetical protein WC551_13960 [Patescibacteria group bacterium]